MTFLQVAITAPIVTGVGIVGICKWMDRKRKPVPVPGLPVDGDPLTDREMTALIRVILDTRHHDVPEPEYER